MSCKVVSSFPPLSPVEKTQTPNKGEKRSFSSLKKKGFGQIGCTAVKKEDLVFS